MPSATYTVEVDWSSTIAGKATVDISTVGGTDVISTSLASFFAGTYDNVTDDTDDITIHRGRTRQLDAMQSGTCTLRLSKPGNPGFYDPQDSTSSITIQPLRPVRIRATVGGVTTGLFYGYIRRATYDYRLSEKSLEIEAEDLFLWLDRSYPVIASTGSITVGEAIGLLLDSIDWTEGAMRSLEQGSTIPDFSCDGTISALQAIENLLQADRGVFYINGSGVATYANRYHEDTAASSYTLTDVLATTLSMTDLDTIINTASVTREGGATQTAANTTSIRAYGKQGISVSTSYLPDDATAANLAAYLIKKGASPVTPVQLALDPETTALLAQMVGRELLDAVTLSASPLTGIYNIEAIDHKIAPGGTYHSTTWLVAKRTLSPAVVDTSTVDSTDIVAY